MERYPESEPLHAEEIEQGMQRRNAVCQNADGDDGEIDGDDEPGGPGPSSAGYEE
jgi:hypothetical protein